MKRGTVKITQYRAEILISRTGVNADLIKSGARAGDMFEEHDIVFRYRPFLAILS